jgi:hypothetical protein
MATAPKTTTTRKKAAPKAPADRLPKAEEMVVRPEETPGWELMKDLNDIPVWEQTPLVSMLQNVLTDGEDEKLSDEEIDAMTDEEFEAYDKQRKLNRVKTFDVNIIGQFAKALIPYAKDEAAFTKFVSGPAAMEKAMNLAMAWVGQMGESSSSEA